MNAKPYIVDGQRVSKDEYNKARFDRFLVTTPKGERDKIKAHAENLGMSLNAFIIAAIQEKMEQK